MLEKLKNGRTKSWPGPLIQFMLDRIDENTLERLAVWHGSIKTDRRWLIEFYNNVSKHRSDKLDLKKLREMMQRLADMAAARLDRNE